MICPHLNGERCALAELLALRVTGIALECRTTDATCQRCQARGKATEDAPTLPCLGTATKVMPAEHRGQWSAFCSWVGRGAADSPAQLPATVIPARSRGLGDTIAKATKSLGITPCGGCQKRQAWLNGLFPYRGE